MSNLPYYLALNKIAGIGPKTVLHLKQMWPNLAELFQTTEHELIQQGLKESIAHQIKNFNFDCIQEDLDFATQKDSTLLTWEDAQYPTLLKEIYDPPFVLYAKGKIQALHQPCIAMVGTRKPTPSGSETAYRFAKKIAESGCTIVSGLALGIDAKVHLGALQNGQTIAVMGTGIDCIYPRQHRHLAEQIQENGLILSEFPLKTTPNAGHFPRRNRIISGLSLGTLVVEAAIKSGSLITARFALEQNREVMAIPGSIHNAEAEGCLHLIKQGATLVSSPHEILEQFHLRLDEPCSIRALEDTGKFVEATPKGLIRFIEDEISSIDTLILRSGLNFDEVMVELALLEMKGLIRSVPGGYARCLV